MLAHMGPFSFLSVNRTGSWWGHVLTNPRPCPKALLVKEMGFCREMARSFLSSCSGSFRVLGREEATLASETVQDPYRKIWINLMFVNPHAAKASIDVPKVETTGNNDYG